MEFVVEPLDAVWNEFYILAVDRCVENGGEWQGLSYDDYIQQEKDGLLSISVARSSGEVVGYALTGGGKDERFLLPKFRK